MLLSSTSIKTVYIELDVTYIVNTHLDVAVMVFTLPKISLLRSGRLRNASCNLPVPPLARRVSKYA